MTETGRSAPSRATAAERQEATGHPEVDAALADLDEIAHQPLAEQEQALRRGHERLRAVLDTPPAPLPTTS